MDDAYEVNLCESCGAMKHTRTAVVSGRYYKRICGRCLGDNSDSVSSNAAGYDRRRGYEDHAQDTVQPYTASGPNPEFARLYPAQAAKMFDATTLEDLKRHI